MYIQRVKRSIPEREPCFYLTQARKVKMVRTRRRLSKLWFHTGVSHITRARAFLLSGFLGQGALFFQNSEGKRRKRHSVRQPVFCFARGNRPPVAVDLGPFHAHDFAAPLSCEKAHFQAARCGRLPFAVGFTSLAHFFVESFPDCLDFVLRQNPIPTSILSGERYQMDRICFNKFIEDPPRVK
jgi:hypothetical protein